VGEPRTDKLKAKRATKDRAENCMVKIEISADQYCFDVCRDCGVFGSVIRKCKLEGLLRLFKRRRASLIAIPCPHLSDPISGN
jgi:hypothetical protein